MPITMHTEGFTTKEVAERIEGISERELFHWLRDAGWIDQNNTPTFIAKARRLLTSKSSPIEQGPLTGENYIQPRFTRLGANTAVRLITYKNRRSQMSEDLNSIGQALHSHRAKTNNKKSLAEQIYKIHASLSLAGTAIEQNDQENAENLLANAITCIMALVADKKLNGTAQNILNIAENIKTKDSMTHQQEQQP